MANVRLDLDPEQAQFLASAFPQFNKNNGTNFPYSSLNYDAANIEAAFWRVDAFSYGSGNVTVDILWYADTASSGNVLWGASIGCITPNTSTQALGTKAITTEVTFLDTHLGTTATRVHSAQITLSSLDAIAANDIVWVRIRRVANDGTDDMTGDANLLQVRLTYSDT